MIRFLLIVILVFYVLYKLGIFRLFIYHAREGYREKDGGMKIYPKEKRPKNTTFTGGEYIDYEEVKD
ncbi:MAG: hypothetical protein N2044_02355 [Cyclobacteriaceae bacterium]|nr:hypothetical protein [Cyclobacteriaceae bacterium]MCX7636668.1 hypothetical protein [Cyclobacteriaceae bacterium]MDW8330953.1 hypothetical protein [Cyclobacteriaceae bacterium]